MDGEGGARTFGIWWLVALFVVLTIAGTVTFVLSGSNSGPTVTLPASPVEGAADGAAGSDDAAVSTTSPPGSATFPDGRPTPDGVTEVLVTDGTTSLSFAAPAGAGLSSYEPVVAPTTAEPTADGTSLRIGVTCATSSDGFLAQISLTEAEDLVSVLAVSLEASGGEPCDDDPPTEVEVELESPLGARTVVVAPAGTPVPTR